MHLIEARDLDTKRLPKVLARVKSALRAEAKAVKEEKHKEHPASGGDGLVAGKPKLVKPKAEKAKVAKAKKAEGKRAKKPPLDY